MSQGYPPPGYRYGPPPKQGLTTGAWVGIAAAAGVVAVGAVAVLGARGEKKTWDAQEAVKVTADELVATYKGNEIAGDEKYKGKKLEISGQVASIDSDLTDDPVVSLKADGALLGVRVEGLSKSAAAKLKVGEHVTLSCKGGGEIVGVPRVDGCSVLDHPTPAASAASASAAPPASTDPLIKRAKRVTDAKLKKHGLSWDNMPTHIEIVREYTANELAADKRFKKATALGGPMRSVARHDNGKVSMTLAGPNEDTAAVLGRHVRLVLDADDTTTLDVVAEVKQGETVLVVCDEGQGATDSFVTFAGCSVWAKVGPPLPDPSTAPAAPSSSGTFIDLTKP